MTEQQPSPPMKIHDVDEEEEERYSDTYDPYPLDPMPEWDVDRGREYKSDPDYREIFSDEERYEQYRIDNRKAFNSKGFIYKPLSGSYPIKYLDEVGYDNTTTREKMTNLANLCIKKLNETKGKTVEFVQIVRVFKRWAAAWKSSITFMARESPNGLLVEYQAKVVTFPGDCKAPIPILCRPSPIDPHLY
ncbi:Cystatin/monellin superfamily protein [Hirschfeldia incana]|nr:Cystatin/monellin superfamily protein [Hirschfeldia incana]